MLLDLYLTPNKSDKYKYLLFHLFKQVTLKLALYREKLSLSLCSLHKGFHRIRLNFQTDFQEKVNLKIQ